MRISEALLDLAQTVDLAFYGTATAGTTTSITDPNIILDGGQLTGGMLIITSGDAQGDIRKIKSHKNGLFTVDRAFTATPAADDTFVVTNADYNRLMQAFQAAVNSGSAIFTDVSITTITGGQNYALPAGVSNVLRVETTGGINRYWHEQSTVLRFANGKAPAGGLTLTVYYRGRVQLDWATDQIVSSVHPEWLKWSSIAHYWRNEIENVQKDNPIAADMVNEARTQLAQATSKLRSMDMPPDPRYFAT